jgi:peroxiredoxin
VSAAATAFALGSRAPDFDGLLGVDGSRYSLSSFAGSDSLAVIFTGNGCPTARAAEAGLIELQETYEDVGLRLLAINANNQYLSPPDTFAEMVARAEQTGLNFPYVKDEGGSVARRYAASRTPQAFLLDRDRAEAPLPGPDRRLARSREGDAPRRALRGRGSAGGAGGGGERDRAGRLRDRLVSVAG